MGLKAKLAALRRTMRGNLDSFLLADGTRYFFNPGETFSVLFRYFAESMTADHKREPRPQPPEILQAVAGAKNREDALYRVMGDYSQLPLDREALVARGEFVSQSLRASDREGETAG